MYLVDFDWIFIKRFLQRRLKSGNLPPHWPKMRRGRSRLDLFSLERPVIIHGQRLADNVFAAVDHMGAGADVQRIWPAHDARVLVWIVEARQEVLQAIEARASYRQT